MLGVWLGAYRETFSTSEYSPNNVDWGGFGDFFWGLGTMLLTGLNVYVFYNLTTIYGKSEEERDKNALRLQQRQFEFSQKMAILNDIRSAILEIHTTHKMSEELRTDIYGILNRVQVLRNLFSSEDLVTKVTNLRDKVFRYDEERDDIWMTETHNGGEMYIPIDRRIIEILNGLNDLSKTLWQDLDNQFNKPNTD